MAEEPRGTAFFTKLLELQKQALALGGQDPRVAALLKSGGSGTINKVAGLRDTDFKIVNGKVEKMATGGVWKPIALAATVAATGGAAGMLAASAAAPAALGPSTAANMAATAAASTSVPAGLSTAGTVVGTGGIIRETVGKSLGYGDALRYGAPAVGNLINGVIQNRAAGKAAEAQEALLREALAYEKDKDLYQRGMDREAINRDENRYAGYQNRIGGFIANGQSSNDRMAQLLGLPARSGGGGGGGGPAFTGGTSPESVAAWKAFDQMFPGETLSPQMLTAKKAELEALGFSLRPNAAGEVGKVQHWSEPRIADVVQGAATGLNKKQRLYGGAPPGGDQPIVRPTNLAPSAAGGYGAGIQGLGQPIAQAAPAAAPQALITVVSPTGQSRQVPVSEREHWVSRGATIQGAG